MRRLLRDDAAELLFVIAQFVRFDGHVAFILVADESNLLDVSGKPLLLDIIPFFFLRIGTILIEEHPTNSYEQEYIDPGNAETNLHGFLSVRCICIFCHSLSVNV